MTFSIVVHAGAGYHSPAAEEAYLAACRRACEAARVRLLAGDGSLAAVTDAVAVLEDDPTCNAGTGSNLTLDGTVEGDASVMDAASRTWGGVAAVPLVPNPVRVAARIARDQFAAPPLSCGRVRPILLCGVGARSWAAEHGEPTLPEGSTAMVTPQARRLWRKYKGWVDGAQGEEAAETSALDDDAGDGGGPAGRSSLEPGSLLHDTVGAVCCDGRGGMSAGVSSGGHWLKHPGRVGEAAAYGAGCWAEGGDDGASAFGVSVSGVGELIVQDLVAKAVARALGRGLEPSQGVLAALGGADATYAGLVALVRAAAGSSAGTEVVWAHGTPSLAVAYLHHGIEAPVAFVSRTAQGSAVVSGTFVRNHAQCGPQPTEGGQPKVNRGRRKRGPLTEGS